VNAGYFPETQVVLSRTRLITRTNAGPYAYYTMGSSSLAADASTINGFSFNNTIVKGYDTAVTSPTVTDFPSSIDLGVYGVQVTP